MRRAAFALTALLLLLLPSCDDGGKARKMAEDLYKSGSKSGYKTGYSAGSDNGYKAGYKAGYSTGSAEGFKSGYGKGAEEAVRKIKEEAESQKSRMKEAVAGNVYYLALAAVFLTLFGPAIGEFLRKRIALAMRLTKDEQVRLACIGYAVVALGLLAWALIACESWASVPVLILLLASAWPFIGEAVPGLRSDDMARRKSGISKVKSLLFFGLVIILVARILSGNMLGGLLGGQ